jgi:hypothetical protein
MFWEKRHLPGKKTGKGAKAPPLVAGLGDRMLGHIVVSEPVEFRDAELNRPHGAHRPLPQVRQRGLILRESCHI